MDSHEMLLRTHGNVRCLIALNVIFLVCYAVSVLYLGRVIGRYTEAIQQSAASQTTHEIRRDIIEPIIERLERVVTRMEGNADG